jgi:hypothetical protein
MATKTSVPAPQLLQLRIALLHVKPKIWRRVVVSDQLTFRQLHDVIQGAMGWENCHLHEFEVGSLRIGTSPDEECFFGGFGGEPALSESRHRLGETLAGHKKFRYWYDFGDDWWHEISIETRLPAAEGDSTAKLLDGENACPPEDCGGPPGYAGLCAAISDPNHPDREELLDWVGEEFDPEAFDKEACAKGVLCSVRATAKSRKKAD